MASPMPITPSRRRRFSLLDLMRSTPKYNCEKCKVTVHEIAHWLEHLGHDPVTDAIVLQSMDPWVNEHPSLEQDPEHESHYFNDRRSPLNKSPDYYVPAAAGFERAGRSRSTSLSSWLRGGSIDE